MKAGAGGYVVWVEFEIDRADRETFLAIVGENASLSVADEPGCRRFDVLREDAAPGSVALYEIYDDETAFNAHLESGHYRRFETAATPLIRGKRVKVFALEEHAK